MSFWLGAKAARTIIIHVDTHTMLMLHCIIKSFSPTVGRRSGAVVADADASPLFRRGSRGAKTRRRVRAGHGPSTDPWRWPNDVRQSCVGVK
jgi:hypothetical protein